MSSSLAITRASPIKRILMVLIVIVTNTALAVIRIERDAISLDRMHYVALQSDPVHGASEIQLMQLVHRLER